MRPGSSSRVSQSRARDSGWGGFHGAAVVGPRSDAAPTLAESVAAAGARVASCARETLDAPAAMQAIAMKVPTHAARRRRSIAARDYPLVPRQRQWPAVA